MLRCVFIILMLAIPFYSLYAEIKVYMLPEAEVRDSDVSVGDICKIEGSGSFKYISLIIPAGDYSDGIIDQSELKRFLQSSFNETVSVFGNGTRVTKLNSDDDLKQKDTAKSWTIKKGQIVKVEVRNNNITITLTGKSLSNGNVDDEIEVKLVNGKKIRCIITGVKQARITL